MKTKNYLVVQVDWSESESGWGSRPDGESIHRTLEDYNQYMNEYWANMPKNVPSIYSRPCSTPTIISRNLTAAEYKKMVSEKGLRRS